MHIRLLLIGFLCTSLLALHITAPQRYIAYIPAMNGPVKVRPANLPDPIPPVVSLIEADRRSFKETARPPLSPWDEPLPYRDHGLILETNYQSSGSYSRPKPEWFEEVNDTFLFCSGPCVGLTGEWPKFEVLTPECSSDAQRYETVAEPNIPAAMVLHAMECILRSQRV